MPAELPPPAYSLPPSVPPQAPPGPNEEERMLAMLCHLLPVAVGFIAPLVIWLVKREQSRFLDHHGREALNFQINLLVVTFAITIVAIALMFIFIGILLIPVVIAIGIGAIVLEVLAGLAAQRGEWHRYPCTVRIL